MSMHNLLDYINDFVEIIKEKARTAKITMDQSSANSDDYNYNVGKLMAYHEVISIMQQEANAFQIPLPHLSLDDIDPEKDLL